MMKKIAVVTATRAEYGLLTPLIRRIEEDQELALELIVTGGHLSDKQGRTIRDIEKDGFPIAHEIPILEEGNTPYDSSLTMANALRGFAECFRDDRPDMVVLLGDRTELLGVAAAAANERIPIAHIHGGEVTEGAVDDCIRHALTKMSYLHFTSTDVYRRRVIQLGEAPERVYCVGSLGAENILHAPLLTERKIREAIGAGSLPYAVVTFHPVTLEDASAEKQTEELCRVMGDCESCFFLITKANADAGGDGINRIFEQFAGKHPNIRLVDSLGMVRYLSAVKYASFVLGNSSSGIIEAPVFGTPTVNIGDRQRGRLMAETVIPCEPEHSAILQAVKKAEQMPHRATNLYGNGNTSEQITETIRRWLRDGKINLKKGFYDDENTFSDPGAGRE